MDRFGDNRFLKKLAIRTLDSKNLLAIILTTKS